VRTVAATRYVTPLREGGSLPAVIEADDGELYVVKFRGAGQGVRALVAELVVGELARAAGLEVPGIALVTLDSMLGRNEPDAEIRDLLRASVGVNLGLAYLPGAIAYDPIAPPAVDEALASAIVWLDACVMNVDRTPRNPNLLLWNGGLWLIDHGAALYFHHAWASAAASAASVFPQVRDHVLLPRASRVESAGRELRGRLDAPRREAILSAVPDDWLARGTADDPRETRAAYARWLGARFENSATFEEEAQRARSALV